MVDVVGQLVHDGGCSCNDNLMLKLANKNSSVESKYKNMKVECESRMSEICDTLDIYRLPWLVALMDPSPLVRLHTQWVELSSSLPQSLFEGAG